MPLYEAKCLECGEKVSFFRRVDSRDDVPHCARCNGLVERVLAAPAVRSEISPYISPATGQVIDSRAKRREDLLRSGSVEWEPGIREDIQKRRESLKEEAFKPIDSTVDDIVRDMVVTGKLEA